MAVASRSMSTTQIAVLLPDSLLRRMDAAVDSGVADDRTDALRAALEQFLRQVESRRVPVGQGPITDGLGGR